MSDHWQNGHPGPPDDPSHGYGSPAHWQGTGGYSSPFEGYGPPPPMPHHDPASYNPGPYPPAPYGAPPPQFLPAHPYYVRPPDRTSATIALIVSLVMLLACMNPIGAAGLAFAAVSLSEVRDHDRAARHARYAWYSVTGSLVLMLLFFGFFWTMGTLA